MTRIIAQRAVGLLALLLAVTFTAFAAMNLLGDPLFNILGPASLSEDPRDMELVDQARAQYHLDDPLPIRYVRWLGDMVTGDFGQSFANQGQPVSDIVAQKLPKTVLLMTMAQVLAIVIAVPWGVWTASRANQLPDRISTVTSFALISVPGFAFAVLLFYVFSVRLGWFPTRFDDSSLGSRLRSLLLPAITLALPTAAVYQRLLRTDLITTLQEDFIVMARSKGVSRRAVLYRHALRPSLFSFITVFGLSAGALIGGSLVVEQVFSIPGVGREIVEAIIRDDYPVVLTFVVLITTGFVVLNFIVDLLYRVLDPRVKV